MNVKIQNHRIHWGKVKETILVILGLFFMAVAFFEAGYIIRDWQKDDTREITLKNDASVKDLHGRVTVLEGPPPKKAEGRRQ